MNNPDELCSIKWDKKRIGSGHIKKIFDKAKLKFFDKDGSANQQIYKKFGTDLFAWNNLQRTTKYRKCPVAIFKCKTRESGLNGYIKANFSYQSYITRNNRNSQRFAGPWIVWFIFSIFGRFTFFQIKI